MSRAVMRSTWYALPHPIRWIAVASAGIALILVGMVLMVLPGPGIPLVILGLVVLSTEFAWAQRTLNDVRRRSASTFSTITRRFTRKER
jgi:hypothetical protein